MSPQTTSVIGKLASTQHGVVARTQLLHVGLTQHEIRGRVRSGALLLAAVLACGSGARLSGQAAAHLYGLTKGRAPSPEVTTPLKRRVEGVRVRRAAIDPLDGATYRATPITAVPRTLTDLAADLPLDALARACHEAGVRYRTTPAQLTAALERRARNTPGAQNLRRIIHGDARVTLSALERRFLHILRENRLPLPRTNRPAGTYHVDCRGPDRRLTVELDSYRFHHSRHAWEQDRRREPEARTRGDELRRYTWGDVCEEPAQMLAELRAALGPAAPESCPAVELSWDACARAPHQ